MKSLQERTWGYVNVTFPVRQVYIRSHGRVQFFTFSPLMQAVCAGASVLVLGWVAFTSVNVIFKDRIIAAKENHFEQMQTSYENRIAQLQLSYDVLNGALVVAEDRFKAAADTLDAKQRTIAQLLEHKDNLRASLGIGGPKQTAMNANGLPAPTTQASIGGGALDLSAPESSLAFAPPYAGPRIAPVSTAPALRTSGPVSIAPVKVAPAPAASQPERATFLKGAVQRFGALFSRVRLSRNLDNPSLRQIEKDHARLTELEADGPALLAVASKNIADETVRLTKALRTTGLNPKVVMERIVPKNGGTGGPFIPLGAASGDPAFNTSLTAAMASLQQLSDVVTTLSAIPLAAPLEGGEVSSGYGARHDPFNESLAFHAGIDFSAPRNTDVFVTALGVVIFAGRNGAYGNSVEVDHGFGIRTRYGHLARITVRRGQRLERGSVIGKLGSTGRSSGPHVHYELWYDQAARNPANFIKAGRYVLQE